jgi:thiol-disulfide isomerase/thioredoxin
MNAPRGARSSRVVAGLGAGLLAAVGLLAGCSSGSGDQQNYVGLGTGDAITLVAPDKRPTPGALQGTTIDGKPISLADFKGHPVVINVWGSWCAPCQKEAPELQQASTELAPKGVRFLGIDTGEKGDKDGAAAFQRAYRITYPSLFDARTDALLALRGAVPPGAIPTTIVLDAQGRIAARITGATTKQTVVDLVDDVLAGRTTRS